VDEHVRAIVQLLVLDEEQLDLANQRPALVAVVLAQQLEQEGFFYIIF
jgi:hypothetical protein